MRAGVLSRAQAGESASRDAPLCQRRTRLRFTSERKHGYHVARACCGMVGQSENFVRRGEMRMIHDAETEFHDGAKMLITRSNPKFRTPPDPNAVRANG